MLFRHKWLVQSFAQCCTALQNGKSTALAWHLKRSKMLCKLPMLSRGSFQQRQIIKNMSKEANKESSSETDREEDGIEENKNEEANKENGNEVAGKHTSA